LWHKAGQEQDVDEKNDDIALLHFLWPLEHSRMLYLVAQVQSPVKLGVCFGIHV
jgi:hypothetical protein